MLEEAHVRAMQENKDTMHSLIIALTTTQASTSLTVKAKPFAFMKMHPGTHNKKARPSTISSSPTPHSFAPSQPTPQSPPHFKPSYIAFRKILQKNQLDLIFKDCKEYILISSSIFTWIFNP